MQTILLTWWTGYIGSHNAVLLLEEWYEVILFDNLSNSNEDVVWKIKEITGKMPTFYNGDLRNTSDIKKVFSENTIDTVIHFAGAKAVWESCDKPFYYYENNIVWTINLCEVMEEFYVKNIIFSSSATVYSPLETPPFDEKTPTGWTTNPYGTSKLIIENILRDLSNHKDFNVINLRYFNPVWAHKSGLIWEDPNDIPNNLLPYIMKVASWELSEISIFWDDYDTIDGTWVRDYIHVVDLARWHIQALKYMENIATTLPSPYQEKEKLHREAIYQEINLWTGRWTSVLEMIHYTDKVVGRKLDYKIKDRRSGDIASAYCNPQKAKDILDWEAKQTVKEAIADSWNFIKKKI